MMTKKIDRFNTQQGKNCIIANLRDILSYYIEDNIDESEIFFGGDGFRIEYQCSGGQLKITARIFDTFIRFLDNTGIQYDILNINEEDNISSVIKNYIDQGFPVIARLMASELDYNPAFQGGENVNHYFNIIGYKVDDSQFFISDAYVPSYPAATYHDWYNQDTVKRSMSQTGRMIIVIQKDGTDKIKSYLSLNTIKGKINSALKTYLTEQTDRSTFYNFLAMEKLADDFKQFLIIFPENFTNQMLMLKIMLKEYGLVLGRQYLLDEMQKIATVKKEYLSILDCLKEIMQKWNFICSQLVRVAVTKRVENLHYLADELNKLITYEKQVFEKIINTMH